MTDKNFYTVITGLHPERGLITLGYKDADDNWTSLSKDLPDYKDFEKEMIEKGFKPRRTYKEVKKYGGGQVFYDLVSAE